jgi:hypothetical protein
MGDEIQQPPDLGERHVERPAMPDEGQPFQVCHAIRAVAVERTSRRRQQPGSLVIADGFAIHSGCPAKFSDAHDRLRFLCTCLIVAA